MTVVTFSHEGRYRILEVAGYQICVGLIKIKKGKKRRAALLARPCSYLRLL